MSNDKKYEVIGWSAVLSASLILIAFTLGVLFFEHVLVGTALILASISLIMVIAILFLPEENECEGN